MSSATLFILACVCIPRHTKMRSTMICASNEIIWAMKEKSESRAEICILTKHFFKKLFFFLNSGEIFYSRHFCPNLGSLTLYSKSILRVSKMLISLYTRNCKALLGIEVTRKHFHNWSQQHHENSLEIYNSWYHYPVTENSSIYKINKVFMPFFSHKKFQPMINFYMRQGFIFFSSNWWIG